MPKKPARPAPADIKRQLEAILGQKIDVAVEQLVKLRFPVGAYDYSENGHSTWRRFSFPLPDLEPPIAAAARQWLKSCQSAILLDASGVASTGTDGKRVFRLSEFVCLGEASALDEPVNVVATPRSDNPFFLTLTHTLTSRQDEPWASDVEITVFTWDADGAAAPNVTFDWRCRVVSLPIIL